MTTLRLGAISAAIVLACALPVAAEEGNGNPGTVNYFTPAQKAQAFRAAAAAGYVPTVVAAFQDGNFFLTAQKGSDRYELTVVPSSHVYASTPDKAAS